MSEGMWIRCEWCGLTDCNHAPVYDALLDALGAGESIRIEFQNYTQGQIDEIYEVCGEDVDAFMFPENQTKGGLRPLRECPACGLGMPDSHVFRAKVGTTLTA